MNIEEFLEGMAELHPMIHRRALDLHSLSTNHREATVKYIKWTNDGGCEVYLIQARNGKLSNHMVTLTKKQLKQPNSEWEANLQRAQKARTEAAARRIVQSKLSELAEAKATLARANAHLAKLQADFEEQKAHARSLITRNNPQGNNDIYTGN